MCETIRTVLYTYVCPRLKTFDNVDFTRQRCERLLNFLYLLRRRPFLEFEQHDVFEHLWTRLLTFRFRRGAVLVSVNVHTAGADNSNYNQAQQIF
jgi:hypothetical protein